MSGDGHTNETRELVSGDNHGGTIPLSALELAGIKAYASHKTPASHITTLRLVSEIERLWAELSEARSGGSVFDRLDRYAPTIIDEHRTWSDADVARIVAATPRAALDGRESREEETA